MNEHEHTAPDDAEIAQLLREAGARDEPSAQVMQEVQAAVHAEWRKLVHARRRRQRNVFWAAAAALAVFAIAATIGLRVIVAAAPIATVLRSSGEVYVANRGGEWTLLGEGQPLRVGDSLRSEGRASLRFENGLELRVDRGTRLQVARRDRLALDSGAVYVDARPDADGKDLTVVTHAGSVRHLGTQYQVRTDFDGIDVGVREGRVMIEGKDVSEIAGAGERLRISVQGAVERTRLAPFDAEWQWAADIAPTFAIDNQPLTAFLAWASRETGRKLVYDSEQAESVAATVELHGSVEGLTPDVALAAVLATTPLELRKSSVDTIEVGLAGR